MLEYEEEKVCTRCEMGVGTHTCWRLDVQSGTLDTSKVYVPMLQRLEPLRSHQRHWDNPYPPRYRNR
jgi:hypothetical protein